MISHTVEEYVPGMRLIKMCGQIPHAGSLILSIPSNLPKFLPPKKVPPPAAPTITALILLSTRSIIQVPTSPW